MHIINTISTPMTLANRTENQAMHTVLVYYLHECLGHSRGQFVDHNSSQMTHHIDRWTYQDGLLIIKHKVIRQLL